MCLTFSTLYVFCHPQVTEETLRETFSAKGYVTDVQLKYTPEGKFRGFAFVGFKTEEQADAAIEFFNGTFIGATKATVEKCAPLGEFRSI